MVISFSENAAVSDFAWTFISMSALLVTDMKPDKCKYVGNISVTFMMQTYPLHGPAILITVTR
jgi:hypothetical protein